MKNGFFFHKIFCFHFKFLLFLFFKSFSYKHFNFEKNWIQIFSYRNFINIFSVNDIIVQIKFQITHESQDFINPFFFIISNFYFFFIKIFFVSNFSIFIKKISGNFFIYILYHLWFYLLFLKYKLYNLKLLFSIIFIKEILFLKFLF